MTHESHDKSRSDCTDSTEPLRPGEVIKIRFDGVIHTEADCPVVEQADDHRRVDRDVLHGDGEVCRRCQGSDSSKTGSQHTLKKQLLETDPDAVEAPGVVRTGPGATDVHRAGGSR